MKLLFTSILLLSVFSAAIVSAGCPVGGVWSEWATGPCPTTCGGYTNVTRTRTCTDRCGDCPCIGPDTDVGPCGLALCPFLFRTCKAPYARSLNYELGGVFFCGVDNVPAVVCP